MTWLKTDDRYPEHRKIRRLNDGAYRLHHTAQCACAKDETDGLITEADLDDMQHIGRLRKYIPDLVAAGLWEVDPRGWLVHDYLDYNPSHLQIEAERAASRERQKKRRARLTGTESPQENHASDSKASADHVANPDVAPSQDDLSRRDSRVSHGPVTRESQPPVPSRPDPTRPDRDKTKSKGLPTSAGPGESWLWDALGLVVNR